MGMFDDLIINSEKLPVSDRDKARLKNEVFQTKSLYKSLLLFEITDDNRLRYSLKDNQWHYEEHHGYVQFYTKVDDDWFEFKAKFTDGICVSIELLFKRPIHTL